MRHASPKAIYLKDYVPSPYLIKDVFLNFHLEDEKTLVNSKLTIIKNPDISGDHDLILDGEELKLVELKLNDRVLGEEDFSMQGEKLCLPFTILKLFRESFTLEVVTEINPSTNKALDGLYKSGNIFCTQNEPEGFRRMTYFLDRPDIMATYQTKIIADQKKYPVLLSNGNLKDAGQLEGGLHWALWEDPFPKPCYLYALVAGDLGLVEDYYTTLSGRRVDLKIYVDKGNEHKCFHAMESLKKSMRWDEEKFGLEYDLDIYMIVAVDSFNMGAMENKGLNIFNSAYVLASPETATDENYLGIESVVAHEYFHNWTGNRVTCRDWFQLTLKEGLTVFRDQEFSADMNSRTSQRIMDVLQLRTFQFAEDAGPTAHPIKPDSYIEINNFYTMTIYEKGAEVIRMLHTLLGEDGFRKGMDRYFERHDGQAVTTEDFLFAMTDGVEGLNVELFRNWYHQAGTPILKFKESYLPEKKIYRLTLEQSCLKTPGQEVKNPFLIPLKLGLLSSTGEDLPLSLKESQHSLRNDILILDDYEKTFEFINIEEKPILSLNRDFSAPIKIRDERADTEIRKDQLFLLLEDSNAFNRYEAGQELSNTFILEMIKERRRGTSWDEMRSHLTSGEDFREYLHAYKSIIWDETLDPTIKSLLLSVPSESLIQQQLNPVNHQEVFTAREVFIQLIADHHGKDFLECYMALSAEKEKYDLSPLSIGKRRLKSFFLNYLSRKGEERYFQLAKNWFDQADNMTDQLRALDLLCRYDHPFTKEAVKAFYNQWKGETLVMQKWLGVQAASPLESTYIRVLELEQDSVFDVNIPNLVRSLIGSFARNMVQFHHPSGRGYKLLRERVISLDAINPQVASHLISAFRDYKRLESPQKALMETELEQIRQFPKLSKNTYEMVQKILDC